MKNKIFKPQLLPNDKAGREINWETRLEDISKWLISNKLDGNRIELKDGQAFSREMNLVASKQVQDMADNLYNTINIFGIVEAEFWAPGMNWAEINHFYKTKDITSAKTRKKYELLWKKTEGGTKTYPKTVKGVIVQEGWAFPGRDIEWACKWHSELGFYAFDHTVQNDTRTKEERYVDLSTGVKAMTSDVKIITQWKPKIITDVYEAFDTAIKQNFEGLVAIKGDSLYKRGRFTETEALGFKIKESNVEFTGLIIGVEEGTIAREGAKKTVNAFGRSKTSQLKEDRIPSGMAKGLTVKMDDGRVLTVSLNGFNYPERIKMLQEPLAWIGETITFTGMNPVKVGGKPRHAHYTKGNLR